MKFAVKSSQHALAILLALALFAVGLLGTGSAGAVPSVRGFDGTTITVAGMGLAEQLPNDAVGAQARIKRFNDTNELKGVKIKFAELADDKQDPATALSEARRVVTEVGAFALVGDIPRNNRGQHRGAACPVLGGGFDSTNCSGRRRRRSGVFGWGCIVPQYPSSASDVFHTSYITS